MSQRADSTNGRTRDRALLLSAAAALAFAVLASAWEFFASQSPSSPLHLGPLAGPVGRLASACWLAGATGLALWSVLGSMGLPARRVRRLKLLALCGWWTLFIGFALGAALGTHGVQVIGAYPRVKLVVAVKLLGCLLLAGFVTDFLLACTSRLRR